MDCSTSHSWRHSEHTYSYVGMRRSVPCSTMLPKLDDFIAQSLERGRGNAYVKEPGFLSLYVRMGPRYLNGVKYKNVFDIASVLAKKPGSGVDNCS